MSLEIVASVVCPFVIGSGFLAVISPTAGVPRLERLAWSFALGAMLTAILVGAWRVSGAPPVSWLAIALPVAFGALLHAAGALMRWRLGPDGQGRATTPTPTLRSGWGPRASQSRSLLERSVFWIMLAGVLGVLVDRIALFNLMPLIVGDETLIWAMRAKLIYEGWVGPELSVEDAPDSPLLYHPDYPLLNPLLQVWVFVMSGRVTDVLNRLPLQAVFIAVVLASASRFRRVLRPAAAAACLLFWLPGHWLAATWFSATADVLVACGLLLAIESWRDFVAERETTAWRFFACASAILAWSKHEGTMLLLCVALGCAVSLVRDRSLRHRIGQLGWNRLWLLLPVGFIAMTWIVNALAGYENDLISANPERRGLWQRLLPQLGDRAWPITRYFWSRVVIAPEIARLLWVAFLAVIVLAPRAAWSARHAPATIAILAGALGYWLVFVGSFHDLDWHLKYAADRIFFHLWPVLLVWTAHMAAEIFPRLRRGQPYAAIEN